MGGKATKLVIHHAAVAQLASRSRSSERTATGILAVIAFLPQGLNEALVGYLLPSLPQVDAICDVLCMQSLVYRQDSFIKMLAPIRHYVRDSLLPPDTTCLQEIRTFYYCTVQQCWKERDDDADIIISDHLNIEHVIAFDLTHIPEDTYYTCRRFLKCLEWHLPRPTTLTPAILNIVENSSAWEPKAYCLWYLGNLHLALSQFKEVIQVFQAAEQLYLTAGNHEMVLEDLQHSDSWQYISKEQKACVWFFLHRAKLFTFTTSADELFVNFLDEDFWGLRSKICHWRVKHFYGEDVVQEIVEMYEGDDPYQVLWYAVWKAVVASNQGHYDLAREIIHKASQNVTFCALPSTASFLHRSYGSACVELNAGEYDRAVSHFTATIEGCDIQGHLDFKAFSIRGLGEIAFEKGDFALAAQRFAETRSMCTEMGVPPRKLHSMPFDALPERCEGWTLFVEGRSPFTNVDL
ncbi:hypothetical protein DFJ58DRAFT_841401 [Suillus subalutaceus]|uniref:uncharacterized protein n=1 Tax=Suillus subalutaceus TaxID=48586 RepID=UPI001B875F9F|nr:uncharacterized protein DFJ58DRAFT_841401 [Suillus subalutaceus]KAG1854490.1 hypothetical protein DFJ58DRAFT_841401 [Suillus subalutaceus]